MAAKATITLNDVVYYPGQDVSPGVSAWYDRPTGTNPAQSILTQNVRNNGNGKQIRGEHKLTLPIATTEATFCACPGSVLRESYAQILAQVAKDATAAERADLLERIRDLVASDVFADTILYGLGGAAF